MNARTLWLLVLAPACSASRARSQAPSEVACLPPGLTATDIVSADRGSGRLVTVTVAQRLRQLRASCREGALIDSTGREIRFYRLHCFGAPTTYALETMRRERVELDSLGRRSTVIGMTCSPSGEPTP